MDSIRPQIPHPIWQTSLLPDNTSIKTIDMAIDKACDNTTGNFPESEFYHVSNTYLHTAFHSPHSFIKYNPSISFLNKCDLLSSLIDTNGNPIDLTSTHPILVSKLVGCPHLFSASNSPYLQPFTYSTLAPHDNTDSQESSIVLKVIQDSQSRCTNNYPTDGLSLDELNVIISAIVASTTSLVKSYPLPRQVSSLSSLLLFSLLQKYPIYSFGPLNMLPIALITAATKILEIPVKFSDLCVKYNQSLMNEYHINNDEPTQSKTNNHNTAQKYTRPWFQEYLPPYMNYPPPSNHNDPVRKLNQLFILSYQFELCHLMHQLRLKLNDDDGVINTLPLFDLSIPDNHNQYPNQPSFITLPPQVLASHEPLSIQPITNIVNHGLNAQTTNEAWTQYISAINHHYEHQYQTQLSNTQDPIESKQEVSIFSLPKPLPNSLISSLIIPGSLNNYKIPCTPTLSHGSFLFQFLLLSLFSTISSNINATKVDSITGCATAVGISLHPYQPSIQSPNYTLLDTLILDTTNFKSLCIAINPLSDIAIALFHQIHLTIPLGYTMPPHLQPFSTSIMNAPLIDIDPNLVTDDSSITTAFLQSSPDLSNNNSTTHIATFIYNLATCADALPLQLLYPPQIIAIAIVDAALSLLQLSSLAIFPSPMHTTSNHTHSTLNDDISFPNETILHETNNTLIPSLPSITKNNILSLPNRTITATKLVKSWLSMETPHQYVQNGFIKRSFLLDTPQSQTTTTPSYWYHAILPGLDPAIISSITFAIIAGTRIGHLLLKETHNISTTTTLMTLQRHPWVVPHQGIDSIPSQLSPTSRPNTQSLTTTNSDHSQWTFSQFQINPTRLFQFYSPQKQHLFQHQLRSNFNNEIRNHYHTCHSSDNKPNLHKRRQALSRQQITYQQIDNTNTPNQRPLHQPSMQPPLPPQKLAEPLANILDDLFN